ncbi:hypothetical protein HDU76_002991 [Blyttiomyces sp. JEL0837]|nr:hypothetical protein HDU76_002991 [Blyttiomyces sp. JEL0837]
MATTDDFFSKMAAEWDNRPDTAPMAAKATTVIKEYLSKKTTDLTQITTFIELGCGTGLLSERITSSSAGGLPNVSTVVGIDPAEGMVNVFNWKARTKDVYAGKEVKGWCLDLSTEEGLKQAVSSVPAADLICSHLVYHHIPDIDAVTKNALSLLKPGTGRLVVTDLLHTENNPDHDGGHSHSHSHNHDHEGDHHHDHDHEHSHTHTHASYDFHNAESHKHTAHNHGFTGARMRECLEGAGFVDVEVIENAFEFERELDDGKGGKRIGVFTFVLASGRRA